MIKTQKETGLTSEGLPYELLYEFDDSDLVIQRITGHMNALDGNGPIEEIVRAENGMYESYDPISDETYADPNPRELLPFVIVEGEMHKRVTLPTFSSRQLGELIKALSDPAFALLGTSQGPDWFRDLPHDDKLAAIDAVNSLTLEQLDDIRVQELGLPASTTLQRN